MKLNATQFGIVKSLVHALVTAQYSALARDGRCGRLAVAEIKSAISAYGRTLADLTDADRDVVEVYPIKCNSSRLVLDIPLRTEEEGLSDLTLSAIMMISPAGTTIVIDDIHVL